MFTAVNISIGTNICPLKCQLVGVSILIITTLTAELCLIKDICVAQNRFLRAGTGDGGPVARERYLLLTDTRDVVARQSLHRLQRGAAGQWQMDGRHFLCLTLGSVGSRQRDQDRLVPQDRIRPGMEPGMDE